MAVATVVSGIFWTTTARTAATRDDRTMAGMVGFLATAK